ncbi:hypothetical protein NSK_001524 [Nannochloropsis salina CCMP1776]|jgi:TatD DNase family protein|uniref:TatD related DNase n=1 Tax=Nannochloropsis salina CCMP1776 TaxID=1027361 RepID=A0A4D9D6K8_9STRA|nr:hypothetical protein NSK_001524 [Nannochloropsis salina CCMP1776]|eukprot:TFJ87192.1 hypothetical protein NSK_001524 [Nannochloropsis salina CCMP1776]
MASGGNDFDNSTADQYVHPLYCLMAVEEADWSGLLAISGRDRKEKKPLLQDVSQNNKEVVAVGLGIHPWKTQNVQSGWEGRLKEALERDPTLIVGEIGLDKARESGKKSWEEQRQIFELQMKLAAELKRPVSVHCVRAYGIVYEWLKGRSAADLPPSVAFHSYTGSLDMAGAFLRLEHLQGSVFFGFSAAVCLRYPAAEAKLRQVLPILPKESLLLESDLDDREAVPGAMNTICDVVAEVKGMERNALAEVTTKNAERFLRRALR